MGLDAIYSGCNCGAMWEGDHMAEPKRRPGRPKMLGEDLYRQEILVTAEVRDAAAAEAEARGISASAVYRDWIERGRKAKKRRG